MKTHYLPQKMVVFCQGNVKPEKIFRLAEKEFGHLPGTNDQATSQTTGLASTNIPATHEHVRAFKKHTHQVHAMIGAKAFPIGHPNQLACFLLNNILGGGSLNSRLNLSLRESKGLVYTVESTYTPLSDTGYWCTYWACDAEDYHRSLMLVQHELELLRNKPLSQAAMQKAIVQLRGQLAISAQNQENTALAMAKSMLYRGFAPAWQETMDKIQQTSIMQLQNVAQEIFNPINAYILTYE